MSGHRSFGGLLRQHDFRLLWIGETTSQLGNAMASIAMPLVAVDVLHASNLVVASLTASIYLPWLVIGLPVGAWVDRLPARPLMLAADVLALLLYASLPAAYWLHVLTIGQMLAVALLSGACYVVFLTAYKVYLPALVSKADLIEGNAKLQAGGAVTRIGGPGLGGLASQAIGPAATLLFDAASFLASAVCLLRIRAGAGEPRRRRPATTIRHDIAEGIRFVAGDRFLRPMAIFAALQNFALAGYLALIVVFLVRSVGLRPGTVGVLLAVGGAGGVLGALVARWITARYGTSHGLILTAVCTTPFMLLIPLTAPGGRLVFCVVGVLMLEAGLIITTIIFGSFQQSYCPPEILGRVGTSMQFLTYSTPVPGALLAGVLASWLDPRNALWIMLGIGASSVALLLTPTFTKQRNLPQPEPSTSVA